MLTENDIKTITVDIPADIQKLKEQPPIAGSANCSATPKRKEHLISVMRYRLNRAMNYFETGKISKGKQDVDETIKVLAILESEILCG